MRGVGAQAHDVLQHDLVVVLVRGQGLPAVLQPQARELAVGPVDHRRDRLRVVAELHLVRREEPRVARADSPSRQEPVDRLRVPAAGRGVEVLGLGFFVSLRRQLVGARFGAPEVLALKGQLAFLCVSGRRPCRAKVEGEEPRVAAEQAIGEERGVSVLVMVLLVVVLVLVVHCLVVVLFLVVVLLLVVVCFLVVVFFLVVVLFFVVVRFLVVPVPVSLTGVRMTAAALAGFSAQDVRADPPRRIAPEIAPEPGKRVVRACSWSALAELSASGGPWRVGSGATPARTKRSCESSGTCALVAFRRPE